MDVLRHLMVALLATVPSVATSVGEDWASSDGVIEVTAPDSARFNRLDSPPEPFLALWISKDATLRLGVLKTTIPAHVKLIRSAVEEGMAEDIGGRITASSTVVKNGHEFWLITAQGSNQGTNVRITQAIARVNGSVYKGMAATAGDGPADAAAIDAFMNSIRITPANSNLNSDPVAKRDQRSDDGIDLHNLSKKIGGAAALLLIIVIVWLVARRCKTTR